MQLADTSAWVWTRTVGGELRAAFDEDLVEGQIATCDMVRLELLHSTRNATEFTSLRSDLDALPNCPISVEHWARALEVYELLAHRGGLHHRAVRHPDLLIAAAAETARIPVLHYDEHYDRIAKITGQDVQWLGPRGTSLTLRTNTPVRHGQQRSCGQNRELKTKRPVSSSAHASSSCW